jgi:hypothetical protein
MSVPLKVETAFSTRDPSGHVGPQAEDPHLSMTILIIGRSQSNYSSRISCICYAIMVAHSTY